jgi:hypothetical protein
MRQTMHLPSKLPCFVKTMALKTSSATGLGGEGRILLSEKGAHCPLRARQPQRCSHLSAECCPPQVPAQSLGPGQKRPLRVPTPTRCLNLASYLRLLVKIQIQGSIAALCIFELQMLPYLQSLLLRFSVRLVISTDISLVDIFCRPSTQQDQVLLGNRHQSHRHNIGCLNRPLLQHPLQPS